LKENRFFISALFFSILLHIYICDFKRDFFKDDEGGAYIPVTLKEAKETKRSKPSPPKKMIIPKLPEYGSSGGYSRRASLSSLIKRYIDIVIEEIEKNKFSPEQSRYYGLIGNVTVGLTIDPSGRFHNITILSPSGDKLLDATALRAVKNTDGKVKRPAWAGSSPLKISLVIKYQYRL